MILFLLFPASHNLHAQIRNGQYAAAVLQCRSRRPLRFQLFGSRLRGTLGPSVPQISLSKKNASGNTSQNAMGGGKGHWFHPKPAFVACFPLPQLRVSPAAHSMYEAQRWMRQR